MRRVPRPEEEMISGWLFERCNFNVIRRTIVISVSVKNGLIALRL